MGMGGENGLEFLGLELDSANFDLRTIQRIAPAVAVSGRILSLGRLDGPINNVSFVGTVIHQTPHGMSSMANGTMLLDTRTDNVGLQTRFTFGRFNWNAFAYDFPRIPFGGVTRGDVVTSGYFDALDFRFDLSGPDGGISGIGTIATDSAGATIKGLDVRLREISLRETSDSLPPSVMTGTVSGSVKTGSGLGTFAALNVSLRSSIVFGVEVDELNASLEVDESKIFFDSLRADLPGGTVVAAGDLGFGTPVSTEMRFDMLVPTARLWSRLKTMMSRGAIMKPPPEPMSTP